MGKVSWLCFSFSQLQQETRPLTHAGYNTEILQELLSHWKVSMGSKPSTNICQCLEMFMPYVAIMDTDMKECGALLAVWPEICLLLCHFHLRQCWTNHQKTILKSKGNEYWRDWVLNALRSFEVSYVKYPSFYYS